MNSYLSILRGILSTEFNYLEIYFNGLEEHRGFCAQSSETVEVVQHISSLLAESSSRTLGLLLLTKFIDQCPSDIFKRKCNLWTTLVLKACNIQELQLNAFLIYEVLAKFAVRSHQVPDLSKSFASIHVSKIYESLNNVTAIFQYKFSLSCIETCLRLYPGSSGQSRGIIERFLWRCVDNSDDAVVNICGKCLHLLQQIKGNGIQGTNHKTQWKNYQIQLLSGIHAMYNEMFVNCTEIYDDEIIEQVQLPWNKDQTNFDHDPVRRAAQMYTQCHNLIKYLVIALREPFPVEKPILLKKILNIVNRGMSVNSIMLEKNPIADNIALSLLLPKLHIDLLELLSAAILILRGCLRPHSEYILGLLTDTLKWTSAKKGPGEQKLLLTLRKKAYETISLWCKVFNGSSRCDVIAEYIFQEILSDITPIQTEFTLKVLSGSRKHMSKKARRQLYNAQNEMSHITQTHSTDKGVRMDVFTETKAQLLCISALRCLQEVLLCVANFVKPTLLKLMQTNITQICAVLYELPVKSSHLYNNNYCRIEIYNAQYVILITPHFLCPPPTEIILTILQTACIRDRSLNVRARCRLILQNLEKLIHPQKESLLFTAEARDIRNTFIKLGQESLFHTSVFDFSNTSLTVSEKIEENIKKTYDIENNIEDMNIVDSSNDQIDEEEKNVNASSGVKNYLEYSAKSPEIILRIDDDGEISTIDEEMTNDNKLELIKNPEIQNATHVSTYHVNIQIDEDSAHISSIDEETSYGNNNINEPTTKKPKIQNYNDEFTKLKIQEPNVSISANIEEDEENILADIASQFVDELN